MGRPSLTSRRTAATTVQSSRSSSRNSNSAAAVVAASMDGSPSSSSSSSSSPEFPRRYPRIGTAFQTNKQLFLPLDVLVKREDYVSGRPAPVLFSREAPHCTVVEMTDVDATEAEEDSNNTNANSNNGMLVVDDDDSYVAMSRRKGSSSLEEEDDTDDGYEDKASVVRPAGGGEPTSSRNRGQRPLLVRSAWMAASAAAMEAGQQQNQQQLIQQQHQALFCAYVSPFFAAMEEEPLSLSLSLSQEDKALRDWMQQVCAWHQEVLKEQQPRQSTPPPMDVVEEQQQQQSAPFPPPIQQSGVGRRRGVKSVYNKRALLEEVPVATLAAAAAPPPPPPRKRPSAAAALTSYHQNSSSKRFKGAIPDETQSWLLQYYYSYCQLHVDDDGGGGAGHAHHLQSCHAALVELTGGRASSARRFKRKKQQYQHSSSLSSSSSPLPAASSSSSTTSTVAATSTGHTTTAAAAGAAAMTQAHCFFPKQNWRETIRQTASAPIVYGDFRNRVTSTNEEDEEEYDGFSSSELSSSYSTTMSAATTATIHVSISEWEALVEYAKSLWTERQETPFSELVCFCSLVSRLHCTDSSGGANGHGGVSLSRSSTATSNTATSTTNSSPTTTLEQLNQQMDECMGLLMEAIESCKSLESDIVDLMWGGTEDGTGVEPEALRKLLETPVPCRLDWADERMRQLVAVEEWQTRVDRVVTGSGDLQTLQDLVREAKLFAFRTKCLVRLEQKLEKAYEFRTRIVALNESSTLEPIKVIASLVREVTRLRIPFPEAQQLVECHQQAESWVDRANVAIRSRISLQEIKELIQRGKAMRADLSEYIEKLLSREKAADEWLQRFRQVVPVSASGLLTEEMACARQLMEKDYSLLHELASEGSRIPVEVEEVKWLQVELDGRNWTYKARKWMPDFDDSKKGRLEDLQEHVEKAALLHDRLTAVATTTSQANGDDDEGGLWSLECETELTQIVKATERWFEENQEVIDGDNRKGGSRPLLSIAKLRKIVEEGNSIFVNLGGAGSKLSRILLQAESWSETYGSLLKRYSNGEQVVLSELITAVEAATYDIAVDLEEAQWLAELAEKIKSWLEAAEAACGSNRRANRNKKVFSVDMIKELIGEARHLPVDTEEYTRQLSDRLCAVEEWQVRAGRDLEQIALAYQKLRETINEACGEPSLFSCKSLKKFDSSEELVELLDDEKKTTDEITDASSFSSEQDPVSVLNSIELPTLVSRFVKEAQSLNIRTPESEVAAEVDSVCRWLMKSVKYLENQRDVFDKRFFGAFDRFMTEGKELVKLRNNEQLGAGSEVAGRLRETWVAMVSDQLERLSAILKQRERYITWCKTAHRAMEEKKLTVEKLREMFEEGCSYPPVACATIEKVRRLLDKTSSWIKSTSERLASGNKMTQQDAKLVIDEGEKLGVVCPELRALRNGLKVANGWANRVRRCKPDAGSADVKRVLALIEEHDSLIIEMPDEVKKLKKTVKNYCICRRPYDGFMIGCDSCDEWFHGPCVGVTESKAGKVDKYVCLRCSVSKLFESSAATIAGVIKKWTSSMDCRRLRGLETQKHQRKVRRESKEIEKFKESRDRLLKQLIKLKESPDLSLKQLISAEGQSGSSSPAELSPAPATALVASASTGWQPPLPNDSLIPIHDPVPAPVSRSIQELESLLAVVEKSLRQCRNRCVRLEEEAADRRNKEQLEDANMELLRRFSIVVRSRVLAPVSQSVADASRPRPDGSMSLPMVTIIEEAEQLGLLRFHDVQEVINAFRCLCWSLRAKVVVSKHPTLEDVQSLLLQASNIKLPDEKALRMLKAMANRATTWQIRVAKAIAPAPGEVRPFDLDHLRELASIGDDIPICMPFESRLLQTIEDNGGRHCLCGGPSDGRFMLSCDSCDRWFHGHCVGVSKDGSSDLEEWKCPQCEGKAVKTSTLLVDEFHKNFDCCDDSDGDDDSSSSASDVEKLWPPYGLLGSEKASEALGHGASVMPSLYELQGVPKSVVAPSSSHVPILPRIPVLHQSFTSSELVASLYERQGAPKSVVAPSSSHVPMLPRVPSLHQSFTSSELGSVANSVPQPVPSSQASSSNHPYPAPVVVENNTFSLPFYAKTGPVVAKEHSHRMAAVALASMPLGASVPFVASMPTTTTAATSAIEKQQQARQHHCLLPAATTTIQEYLVAQNSKNGAASVSSASSSGHHAVISLYPTSQRSSSPPPTNGS